MTQRMSATERRAQLLTIMQEMHAEAQSQADFTTAKIAQAAGISTVMLYRLVRPEFQTLRSELPGSRRPTDEVMRTLRLENADLRRQLREARERLRTTAVEELDEAIRLWSALRKRISNCAAKSNSYVNACRKAETCSYTRLFLDQEDLSLQL